MNIWLIGGVAYLVLLCFALALCRVASPPDRRDEEERRDLTDSARSRRDYDDLAVAVGLDRDVTVELTTEDRPRTPSAKAPPDSRLQVVQRGE